jgi:hypothetical protein
VHFYVQWGLSRYKKNSPIFSAHFYHQYRFLGTGSDDNPHHCQYATVGSKFSSEGGFEPTVM